MGRIWLSGSANGGSEREGGDQDEVMQYGNYTWEFLQSKVSLVVNSNRITYTQNLKSQAAFECLTATLQSTSVRFQTKGLQGIG